MEPNIQNLRVSWSIQPLESYRHDLYILAAYVLGIWIIKTTQLGGY